MMVVDARTRWPLPAGRWPLAADYWPLPAARCPLPLPADCRWLATTDVGKEEPRTGETILEIASSSFSGIISGARKP
jgi:hypothetical protein